jgi:hypothetical protein
MRAGSRKVDCRSSGFTKRNVIEGWVPAPVLRPMQATHNWILCYIPSVGPSKLYNLRL